MSGALALILALALLGLSLTSGGGLVNNLPDTLILLPVAASLEVTGQGSEVQARAPAA